MSAPLAFALLGLAQLALAYLTDHVVGPIGRVVFARGVSERPVNGIAKFFASSKPDDQGAVRLRTVLRIALLSAAARATVTALVVSLIGLVVTGVIVVTQAQPPGLEAVRATADFGYAGVVLAVTILLLVRIAAGSLKPNQVVPAGAAARQRRQALWARLRSTNFLAPYLSIAFVGNVVMITTAIGL